MLEIRQGGSEGVVSPSKGAVKTAPNVVRAAGGLILRGRDRAVEVVLIHRPAYDDWSFPKGKLHAGESDMQAALREVEEEVGVRGVPGRELGSVSYIDRRGRPKIVRYWEMTIDDDVALRPGNEVDDARWVSTEDASGLLTYDHDRSMLDRISERP